MKLSNQQDDSLFNFDKPPILMIGSGISKRYLSDYKTWDELLQTIAKRMGIDKRTYIAHRHRAEDDPGKYGPLPELADNLRRILLDELTSTKISTDNLFINAEELSMYDKGIDPFKILVSSEVSTYSIIESESIKQEIENFRDLINIVPAIITTNFDRFLEKEIFKEFVVYSSVSDYYYYESDGIGEIFKIHGSAEMPESLVITSKDYENYAKKSKIVSSKILSMMCDYPLLIMGYSLSDNDVTQLIYDLMSSLNEEGLHKLRNNMIYIVYQENLKEPLFGTKTFKNDNGEFTLKTITISDFGLVYNELKNYTPSTSPTEIRKIRQLVKNIVLTAEPTEKQYMKLGIDSLDEKNTDRITLIISDKEVSKVLKDYTPITSETLIDDFLLESPCLNPNSVIKYFSVCSNLQPNMYIPLYTYIHLSEQKSDNYSQKLIEFLNKKELQLKINIEKAHKIFKDTTVDKECIFEGVKDYNKPVLIVHLLDSGEISTSEAKHLLKQLRPLYGKDNSNFDTNYRCAITLTSKLQE